MGVPLVYHPLMSGIFHCKRRYPLGKPQIYRLHRQGNVFVHPWPRLRPWIWRRSWQPPERRPDPGNSSAPCGFIAYINISGIYINIYINVYMYLCTCICIYTYINNYQHILYMYIYMYTHIHHIHTHRHTHIHTDTHTHMHACMHTYIHSWTLTTFCTSVDSLSHALMGTLGAGRGGSSSRQSLQPQREPLPPVDPKACGW